MQPENIKRGNKWGKETHQVLNNKAAARMGGFAGDGRRTWRIPGMSSGSGEGDTVARGRWKCSGGVCGSKTEPAEAHGEELIWGGTAWWRGVCYRVSPERRWCDGGSGDRRATHGKGRGHTEGCNGCYRGQPSSMTGHKRCWMRGLVCGNACALEVWCAKIKEGERLHWRLLLLGLGKVVLVLGYWFR